MVPTFTPFGVGYKAGSLPTAHPIYTHSKVFFHIILRYEKASALVLAGEMEMIYQWDCRGIRNGCVCVCIHYMLVALCVCVLCLLLCVGVHPVLVTGSQPTLALSWKC